MAGFDLTLEKINRLTSVVTRYQIWLKRQSVRSLLRLYDACYYSFITRIAYHSVFQNQDFSRRRTKRHDKTVVNKCCLTEKDKMSPKRVILMSCGSYNPPTNMHLRMFEIARDHLHRMGNHIVVGGVISPVHDAYAKKELAPVMHRCAMLRLALQNNDWIRLSSWETRQSGWTRTKISLQHHQNLLNLILFDTNDIRNNISKEDLEWIPENIKNSQDQTPIQIKLLCGADLLESFGKRDLWMEEDIDAIVGQHGLVVITREGSNPNKFIYDSDILSRHMHNIHIVTEWIPNEISSTKIRRALKRGESIRYLIQDSVIDYVYKNGIYDAKSSTTTIKLDLTSPNANDYLTIDPKYQSTFLSPSPSDVTMESPSPVEIISIDVPDTVLRKNLQNATSAAFVASRQPMGLEEAREKFINAITAENGNAKHVTCSTKAAYPGQAKQIIATESGESQLLDEVGLVNEDSRVTRVPSKLDETSSNLSTIEDVSVNVDPVESVGFSDTIDKTKITETDNEKVDDVKLESDDIRKDNNIRLLSVEENVVKSEIDTQFECALSDYTLSTDTYSKLIDSDKENAEAVINQNVKVEIQDLQSTVIKDTSNENDQRNNSLTKESNTEQHIDETSLDTAIDMKKDREEDNVLQNVELSPAASTIEVVSVIENPMIKNLETCEAKEKNNKKIVEDIKIEEKIQPSKRSSKRDSNLEIDGKYLKSVVNSRKSPRKVKDSQLRQFECISPNHQDHINDIVIEQKPGRARSLKLTNPRRGTSDTRSQETTMNSQQYDTVLKGSLDSMINANEFKKTLRKKTGKTSKDAFSKKSKSYESIKKIQEVYLGEPSRTDSSTSQTLVTAEEFDPQTEEFCSICCYMNELTMKTEEEISSPNQEIFYTLRSNCSSLEDSTECDICSSWNLQSSNEVLDRTILSTTNNEESLCEICEICGEVGDNMEFQKEPMVIPRLVKNYQEKRVVQEDYKILDNTTVTTDVSLEEDSFEIENCGLMSGTESMDDRGLQLSENESKGNEKVTSKSIYSRGSSLKTTEKYFVPKDELAILSSGSRKITRKGSLLKKKPEDHQIVGSQDKRRYSSADNLQLAKVFTTKNDKCLRSKSGKSTGSADNIRSSRNSSRRCKSLQRSADNVRYLDSSTDNLDSLAESLGQEDNDDRAFDWNEKPKVRDNETVKLILTKHGIKIISEKETAL